MFMNNLEEWTWLTILMEILDERSWPTISMKTDGRSLQRIFMEIFMKDPY